MTVTDTDAMKQLLVVQDHDRSLDALRHQLATLPEFSQIEQLRVDHAALGKQSELVAERRHELGRDQNRLEDEVALVEDRITGEEAKLYSGQGGVKELQALQDEIKGLRKRQVLVEDQIIEIMEASEPVDAELAELATSESAMEDEIAAANQRVEQATEQIGNEITETEAQRADAAGSVRTDVLEDYDRIRSRPGTLGVARLVGSTCHGCHLELPAVEVDRLKKLPADTLVHCDECGIILVR